MSAKDVFLNGFYGVFEKIASEDEEGKKPMFPFKKKEDKGEKKEEKKEKKEEKEEKGEEEESGEEKAASVFMDGFFSFFDKTAEVESPLDSALEKIGKKWIAGATKNKGGLHASLGMSPGADIPEKKKKKAAANKAGKVGKQGKLALTLAKLQNKGKKKKK